MNYYVYNGQFVSESELYHHGIKGMKWGHRKKIDYAGEGVVSRQKKKQPRSGINPNAGKSTLGTSANARKMGSDLSKAMDIARKTIQKGVNKAKNKNNDKSPYQQERNRQRKHIAAKRAIDIGSRFVNEYTKRHDVSINGMHAGIHDNVKAIVNKLLDYKYMKDTFK